MNTKPRTWGWTLLFTSTATLLCCALPILLVSLGMGAVVASMASSMPWLIFLSMYKEWMFGIFGSLLAIAAWALYRPGRSCPTDPELRQACKAADKWNAVFLWVSAAIWVIGFFYAFVIVQLLPAFGTGAE